jgi:hypothetical protein
VNVPNARWRIAPSGHGIREVVLDRDVLGKIRSSYCWATCICTEPFQADSPDELGRQVIAHYAEISSTP